MVEGTRWNNKNERANDGEDGENSYSGGGWWRTRWNDKIDSDEENGGRSGSSSGWQREDR